MGKDIPRNSGQQPKCSEDLTRFNKIAIQGTPQMVVDKEAILCLSRVYSYYSKCNLPLFYVYPALTRYLSILFLNILTLLACTHSSDNLFHTLMVLWENETFLTSNLLSFFTRVKLCHLVILLSLISKKKVRTNIFITIYYLKHFYLIAFLVLSVHIPLVVLHILDLLIWE